MPEERVIVTAVTLPSEVCNFTWYSAVGFSAPLREASDKPRPAARRHGLWRHSPRRGRRIRRSGCGRRCRRDAAPSASLRKASLRALSAAAFWRPLPWPSSRRRPSRRRPFQPRPFRRPPSRQQPFRRRPSWRRLPWPSSRRRPFGCGLFRSGLVGGSLVSGLAFLFRRFSFSSACLRSSSRRAFSWRPRRLRAPFPLPHASSWLAAARSQGRLPTWAAGPWVRAEAGRIRLLLRLGFRLRLGLRLGFGRFGRGRRRNGRIAVRPELHFHRAGRFRAPVQVEDQHGQQQRVHQQGQKQGFPVVSVGRRGRGRCGVE